MATNVPLILISQLTEQTTAADTDCIVIGNTDTKKMKWSTLKTLLKSALGINTINNQLGGYMIQVGNVPITPTEENKAVSQSITFPKAFSAKPEVFVNAQTGYPGTTVLGASASNITDTGCTIYMTRANLTATRISWVAIGKA